MTTRSDTRRIATTTALFLGVIGVLIAGCSGTKEQSEQECVDPPPSANAAEKKTVQVERFGLGKAGDEDKEKKDWCRACVMSKVGYASCQRVFASAPDEDRDSLRKKARDKACVDAKFPKDACPDEAVINIQCKGDAPPAGTPDPGKALQNLYQKMGGGQPQAKPEVPPKSRPQAESPPKPAAEAAPPLPTKKPAVD